MNMPEELVWGNERLVVEVNSLGYYRATIKDFSSEYPEMRYRLSYYNGRYYWSYSSYGNDVAYINCKKKLKRAILEANNRHINSDMNFEWREVSFNGK